MKADEYEELSPMSQYSSPRGAAAGPTAAQRQQACCNTALLAISALCLAILAAKDGPEPPPATLATAVPGIPGAFDTLDTDLTNWREVGEAGAPMPLWYHEPTGRVWADVAGVLDTDLLFVEQLTQGVGIRQSARGGLGGSWDAGRPMSTQLVHFRRQGPKILLVALQTKHRSSDPAVQSSVEQSFANSVLFSFAAHDRGDQLGIDLTELVLRDVSGGGLVKDLNGLPGNANFVLDVARSLVNPAKTKAKPSFSCIEANITAADTGGGGIRSFRKSLADPAYITIAVRRSFIVLPPLDGPDAFGPPRPFIPKSGYSTIAFTDEAAPLLAERSRKYIKRHRIGGVDPGAPLQDGHGILYYLDRGCPEPMLSALVEGVRWRRFSGFHLPSR